MLAKKTSANMCALFPESKIHDYFNLFTFENYLENAPVEDVIKKFGIVPQYLNHSLKIHPHDILITHDVWDKIEDSKFKDLMGNYPVVYKLDLNVDYANIFFPLTRDFNHRFDVIGIKWFQDYFMTLCDHPLFAQDRVSLKTFCDINGTHDKARARVYEKFLTKYTFAVNLITPKQIKNIQRVTNPLL